MKLSEMISATDPAEMPEDQLRAEVAYWRTQAAGKLRVALAEDDEDRAGMWLGLLSGALSRDDIPACFACGEVMAPGQATLRAVEEGDAHAWCMGDLIGGEGEGKPGDRYQLDPESIVDENDEEVAGSDGILTAFAFEPYPSTDNILALLDRASEWLSGLTAHPAPSDGELA